MKLPATSIPISLSDEDEQQAQSVMYGLADKKHPTEWTAIEVLFAFMGWMTSRHHDDNLGDCSLVVHRIGQFCERHEIPMFCSDGWEKAIIHETTVPTREQTEHYLGRNWLEEITKPKP